tara:strand:- start:8392 stop:8613 length:222 start_codon:yes stop_codon:yes gene_type:complete
MAKQSGSKALNFLAGFTGVIVSLVVGNAMIQGILAIPSWLGGATATGIWITMVIGWIIVITTLISAVLAVIRR